MMPSLRVNANIGPADAPILQKSIAEVVPDRVSVWLVFYGSFAMDAPGTVRASKWDVLVLDLLQKEYLRIGARLLT